MADLGTCPKCGEVLTSVTGRETLAVQWACTADGICEPQGCDPLGIRFNKTVRCGFCGAVRPDLICKGGRIEKREPRPTSKAWTDIDGMPLCRKCGLPRYKGSRHMCYPGAEKREGSDGP